MEGEWHRSDGTDGRREGRLPDGAVRHSLSPDGRRPSTGSPRRSCGRMSAFRAIAVPGGHPPGHDEVPSRIGAVRAARDRALDRRPSWGFMGGNDSNRRKAGVYFPHEAARRRNHLSWRSPAAVTLVGIVARPSRPRHGPQRPLRSGARLPGQSPRAAIRPPPRPPAPCSGPRWGSAYWVRLTKTSPPLVTGKTLRCPSSMRPKRPRASTSGRLGSREARRQGTARLRHAHQPQRGRRQGGNVLLKSGEFVTDHTGVWLGATALGKVPALGPEPFVIRG
jgi:hypothetical protein